MKNLDTKQLESTMAFSVAIPKYIKGKNSPVDLDYQRDYLLMFITGNGTEENPGMSKQDINDFITNNPLLNIDKSDYEDLSTKAQRKLLVKHLMERFDEATNTNEEEPPTKVLPNKIVNGKVIVVDKYAVMPQKEVKAYMEDYSKYSIKELREEISEWGGHPATILSKIFKRKAPDKEQIKNTFIAWLIECDIALYALGQVKTSKLEKLAMAYNVKSKKKLAEKLVIAGWRLPNNKQKGK